MNFWMVYRAESKPEIIISLYYKWKLNTSLSPVSSLSTTESGCLEVCGHAGGPRIFSYCGGIIHRWQPWEILRQHLSTSSSHLPGLWHPTPVLLPGKSYGQRSLVGCSPRGRWESDTTKWLPTFTFHFHALEKEMATHSSDLAWRIPGKGEPGGLPSMGSHSVGHNWSGLVAAVAAEI